MTLSCTNGCWGANAETLRPLLLRIWGKHALLDGLLSLEVALSSLDWLLTQLVHLATDNVSSVIFLMNLCIIKLCCLSTVITFYAI